MLNSPSNTMGTEQTGSTNPAAMEQSQHRDVLHGGAALCPWQPHTAGLSQLSPLQKTKQTQPISTPAKSISTQHIQKSTKEPEGDPSQQHHGCSHGGSPTSPSAGTAHSPAPPSVTPAGSDSEAATGTQEFINDFWCSASIKTLLGKCI